jgi:hypothetical protein
MVVTVGSRASRASRSITTKRWNQRTSHAQRSSSRSMAAAEDDEVAAVGVRQLVCCSRGWRGLLVSGVRLRVAVIFESCRAEEEEGE